MNTETIDWERLIDIDVLRKLLHQAPTIFGLFFKLIDLTRVSLEEYPRKSCLVWPLPLD